MFVEGKFLINQIKKIIYLIWDQQEISKKYIFSSWVPLHLGCYEFSNYKILP